MLNNGFLNVLENDLNSACLPLMSKLLNLSCDSDYNSTKLLHPILTRNLNNNEISFFTQDIFSNIVINESRRIIINGKTYYGSTSTTSTSNFIIYQNNNLIDFASVIYFICYKEDFYAIIKLYKKLKRTLFSDIVGRPMKTLQTLRNSEDIINFFFFIRTNRNLFHYFGFPSY